MTGEPAPRRGRRRGGDARRPTSDRRLLLCALFVLGGCTGPEQPPKAPPRMVFAETSHDEGRVAQGTPLEHRFAFVNDGGIPLTIIELRTGCGCEAAVDGEREVPPGGSGAVRLRCDTDRVYGPQRHTVTVYSNDPVQRAMLLALSGTVALDAVAEPAQVYLGIVPPGAAALRQVALLAGDESVLFATPSTDAAQLAVQIVDTADGRRLVIGTARNAPLGPFTATVRVPTTSAQHPVLRIAVTGTVSADAAQPTLQAAAGNGRAGGAAP